MYDIDQVEIFSKIIIFKPGKQRGEGKKVNTSRVVVPEDKNHKLGNR